MERNNEWQQAVEKLLSLTRAGKLVWHKDARLREVRDQVEGDGYIATVQGRKIAVYENRERLYSDEDSWEWEPDVAIEFIDDGLNVEYRWPKAPLKWQLLDAVRYSVSNARTFLDEFLKA